MAKICKLPCLYIAVTWIFGGRDKFASLKRLVCLFYNPIYISYFFNSKQILLIMLLQKLNDTQSALILTKKIKSLKSIES